MSAFGRLWTFHVYLQLKVFPNKNVLNIPKTWSRNLVTKPTLCDKNAVEKLQRFEESRKKNTTVQFLMKFKDMVTILFENASRLRKY